jgi:hypothetical protein
VKVDLVVPHILLVLHVYGWDVQVLGMVYRCSSCGVAVLSVNLQPINEHESTDKCVSRKTALDIISKIHIFALFINVDM